MCDTLNVSCYILIKLYLKYMILQFISGNKKVTMILKNSYKKVTRILNFYNPVGKNCPTNIEL